MSLRIIKPGVLDTIQDAGRYGFRHLGVNPSGAMDKYAMRVANILVGNEPDTPVIELHFPASAFFFEQPALVAICGSDFFPTVNAEKVPLLQPILVSKFAILQFENMKKGARAYLAIRGGLQLTPWLGSYSTNLKAGAGGLHGRSLQKDDEIGFRPPEPGFMQLLGKKEFHILPWKADDTWSNKRSHEIAVLPGSEWDWLANESKVKFLEQRFTVTAQSDRMGYRLSHTARLKPVKTCEMISSAVSFGTIQLLPDGKLILLMADHQTTGGYPRIAHVISADHSRVAQMKAGDRIRFTIADQQTAEELLVQQQQHLQQLQHACTFRLQPYTG